MAGKGCLQFRHDARAHLADHFRADLLHEGCQQPARDRPAKAEAACQDGRRHVQPAIDVELLERVGAVAAILLHPLDRRRFHGGHDHAALLATADGVKGAGDAGFNERRRQISHEAVRC